MGMAIGKEISRQSMIYKGITAKALSITLLVLCMFSGTAASKTLMLGHTVPPTHVWHKVVVQFAQELKTASDGRFKIKINPLSKLGNEQQMVSMLQSGALAFTMLPVGVMSNREDSLLGWFLPYLFENVSEAGAAVSLPAASQMLKNLEPHGAVGIGYCMAGMRHVLSVKPISSPTDLHNKKVRAFPSPIFNDWWKSNGAAATALALGEIAPSLTTNLLDAVDVDLDIIVGLKYHQQAPYLALTNHMAFPSILMASKKWWDTLSPEDQALIHTVYSKAEKWGTELQAKAEISNLEKLKADGVTVTEIDLAQFKTIGKAITDKYVRQNSIIKDFFEQVKNQ